MRGKRRGREEEKEGREREGRERERGREREQIPETVLLFVPHDDQYQY